MRLAFALVLALVAGIAWADAPTPVLGYRIVHAYPHDRGAFTEGLFYHDGFLYESTGMNGHSSVRKVELETGRVVQQRRLPYTVFGEGIVDWHDHLVGLTWKNEQGYVLDLTSFEQTQTFAYRGEGWGLTHDDEHLLMSDGSARIRLLDPRTLAQVGAIDVTDQGRPVTQLNELEWIKGAIYANVWQTQRIARIDPKTGHVTAWIDLTGLLAQSGHDTAGADVLNGIAWDGKGGRLFVTGKYWPDVFQIELTGERGAARPGKPAAAPPGASR